MEIKSYDDAKGRPITIRPPGDVSPEDVRQRAIFLKCKHSVLYRFAIKLLMKFDEFFLGTVLNLSERWNRPPWDIIENFVIAGISTMDYDTKMGRHGLVPFILEDGGLIKGKALYDWIQEELAIRDESRKSRARKEIEPYLPEFSPEAQKALRKVWEE